MIRSFRYWLSDILYDLADRINPNEPEVYINGKPISECTKEEMNIFTSTSLRTEADVKEFQKHLFKKNK